MAIDDELNRAVMAHAGVTDETHSLRSLPGGVKFSVGHRSLGGWIILGVSRQFFTVEMTPSEAKELARNLINAANGADDSANPVVPKARVVRRKVFRSVMLSLVVLAVTILCGLVSR